MAGSAERRRRFADNHGIMIRQAESLAGSAERQRRFADNHGIMIRQAEGLAGSAECRRRFADSYSVIDKETNGTLTKQPQTDRRNRRMARLWARVIVKHRIARQMTAPCVFENPQEALTEICRELGGRILERYPHLKVDVERPDVLVMVEIREAAAYIHGKQLPGAGGIPIGTSGKAAILISGGIDSPVAGYMMAKRGLELCGVHFASPPYTSERAEMKVVSLLEQVARYAGRMELHIVPFTHIQEEIQRSCPEELFTLIMRRFMMRLAASIAKTEQCGALITGESVGQVASQTIPALACTDAVADMPVFRPVIGMDKDEIIAIARRIDTFDISIQPYEDCCTVFTPRHPRTRPKLAMVEEAEKALDIDALMAEALAGVRRRSIS